MSILAPSLTNEHCQAVHAAIIAGEITEGAPISDALMEPFITASTKYIAANQNRITPSDPASEDKVKQDSARAPSLRAYHIIRQNHPVDGQTDGNTIHTSAQGVQDAVTQGFKARGFDI